MEVEDEILSWGSNRGTYQQLVELEVPRARSEGTEHIVVYEIIQTKAIQG